MLSPLYLVDAYALIYRSYFAFLKRPFRNSAGRNVSALFGFARTLANLINKGVPCSDGSSQAPELLIIAFDSRGKTFRHKLYADYKANRNKAPEDLHNQVPLIEELLSALGIPMVYAEGFEADDIIASLAERCKQEKRECYILSSDKDLLQLVGDGVYELRPSKDLTENWELLGMDEVKAIWGVQPALMLDFLSLAGDSSDNIPGVSGIGEKTAAKLIARYGSLDGVYANIAGIEGAAGRKLAKGRESAYFSKKLIALRSDVPLKYDSLEHFSIRNINKQAGAEILAREDCRETAEMFSKGAWKAALERNVQKQQDMGTLLGNGVYKTVLDIVEIREILAQGRKQGCIALDFETDSLDAWHAKPVGLSFAVKAREAIYVPVAPHEMSAPFVDPSLVKEALIPLLEDPDFTVIAHNAKYDYEVSRAWGCARWRAKIWDTMIAAWLIDPERSSYSLDNLTSFYFNHTSQTYHNIVPKGMTFLDVPLEKATYYSGEDADLCFRLKMLLEPRLEGMESLFYKIEMPLLPILAEMEGVGIRIEKQSLAEYGVEIGVSLDKLQGEIFHAVGHKFNIASTLQLQKVLFDERGLKPGKKTKTGYSTDMTVLEELAGDDPVPAMILHHRTLSKLKSTYVDALEKLADEDDRVHTSFVQTGTATGRLSSRDPNLQNIPVRDEEGRRIREAFIARPGYMLISADYSQIELVILAHLSNDENLTSAFREGKDVHIRTAGLIFGIDESAVTPNQRRIAKIINFGVIYGMSAFRLARELGTSRHEATDFIEAYFRTYSGVSRLIAEIIRRTEETGFVTTILGRRRLIPAINSSNRLEKAGAERVAVNTPIQGSAADIVKIAMLNVDKALTAMESPARLLLQVHDELILEAPEADANDVAAVVRECMERAANLKVPLRMNVGIGKRWGDLH
ncbi:MAG: DNA polymerase I [Treponema sp.]|jgi:DNA polymerase-1|nr:DNA polymerase I [Treponema sp.]